MTEQSAAPDAPPDDIAALRARADALEVRLREAMETAQQRLVKVELKAEAIRAGMIDLDGLKLIEPGQVAMSEQGEIEGAAGVIQKLKRAKPWLFNQGSSSSTAAPPPSAPPRAKHATEMTLDEWRAARTELLRRRN
jgi:hypothetical protein